MQDFLKQIDNILSTWGDTNFITESDQNDVRRDLGRLRAALGAATPAPASDEVLDKLTALIKKEEEAYTSHNPWWGEIRDEAFRVVYNAAPALLARVRQAEVQVSKLQAFKDFVHTTLDSAGVDKHEEQNATTGCRVGARLADLINAAAAPSLLADAELTAQRDMALEAADQLFRSGFINDIRRADMRRRISLHFKKTLQKGPVNA